MKLISNTKFGLSIVKTTPKERYAELRDNYDNLLIQKLEIWQFVPCKLVDGVWVVLEEPKYPSDEEITGTGYSTMRYSEELKEYQEAKERCLFEGFEIKIYNNSLQSINYSNVIDVFWKKPLQIDNDWYLSNGINTIEDLVKYNLELTQTALKQIGL